MEDVVLALQRAESESEDDQDDADEEPPEEETDPAVSSRPMRHDPGLYSESFWPLDSAVTPMSNDTNLAIYSLW